MKYYTGVGSRETPEPILNIMHRIAIKMAQQNITLRSGHAVGADLAFEYGCDKGGGRKEIYLAYQATPEAMEMAAQFHPAWNNLQPYVKRLHGRNAFQILGLDLQTPSTCVVCWTKDGCTSHATRSIKTGGTGTAISIASHNQIPVYNLANAKHLEIWETWLERPS